MDFLGTWVKNLVFLVLFAAFLELLLPNRAMQKYLRVIVGLLIVAALLEPLEKLTAADCDWRDLPVFSPAASPRVSPAADGRERLAQGLYRRELERHLQSAVESMPEVASAVAVVRLNGAPSEKARADLIDAVVIKACPTDPAARRITVNLQKKAAGEALTPQLKNKIVRRLHELYEIPAERIVVEAKTPEKGEGERQ